MAGVPSSGTLEMLKLARERKWGDYSGNATINGPISMFNLILGGNTGGGATSGDTYPSPNASSPTVLPSPPPNPIPEVSFADFYGYQQITTRTAFNYVFNSSSSNNACASAIPIGPYYHTGLNADPEVGNVVYQLQYPSTVVAGNGYYAVYATGFPGGATGNWFRITDSNGTVAQVGSC